MKNVNIYEKLLQLFVVGYNGIKPDETFCDCVKNGLGGVIFFAENLKKRDEFKENIENLKKLSKTPLFLSIDQEGGLVERTIFLDEKIEYLTPKTLSLINNDNATKQHYDVLAKDLNDLGINLNFAPVLDVNSNPDNPIIAVRSFENYPAIVNRNAKIVIDVFKKNNIISCGKHYPGHGDTDVDSHKNMPCINMDFDEFYKTHLVCFEEAIKNNVDTIMVSHIHFPFWDKEVLPASLSKNAVSYLKNELNFKGIIFSDDMVMGGISKHFGLKESILLGLKAGIDSFVFRNLSEELLSAIEEISKLAENDEELKEIISNNYEKIINFKNKGIKEIQNEEFLIQNGQIVIDNIAREIKTKYKNIPYITREQNIKILSFDYKEIFNLSNNNGELKDFLQDCKVENILYPLNLPDENINQIAEQIDGNDFVIFLSYNPSINKNQIKLFNLINCEKLLVHVGLDDNTGFLYKHNPIALCSAKTPMMKTLAEMLTNK